MPSRYHRQEILPQIGAEGQQKIAAAPVILIGCGALGAVMAEMLVRAGIGRLRVVDRDIVEMTNLQRQTLFTESDAREGMPKAIAAAERLKEINSEIVIEPVVVDVDSANIEDLLRFPNSQLPCLILDGTDNVETRYLINDVAVKHGIPWVYAAAVGVEGRVMGILPGKMACLRCVFPNPPVGSELATCETAGVLAAASGVVASLAVAEGMKLLLGEQLAGLISVDVWAGRFGKLAATENRDPHCICCAKKDFEFLRKMAGNDGAKLCGRNAVQIRGSGAVDLAEISRKLERSADVKLTPYMLRADLRDPAGMTLSVFPDGRAIVAGTADIGRARGLVARFIGA